MMKKGLSLVELMVAITVLSLTMGAATDLSVSLLHQERRALATQNIMDNSSYFLEYGGRFLRMAQKDDGGCITSGLNYQNVGGTSTIQFLDYENHCREFLLDSGQIKEKVSTDDTAANLGVATAITSPKITITALSFTINGDTSGSQPRVTIKFHVQDSAFPEASMNVQTTVSQRNLNS